MNDSFDAALIAGFYNSTTFAEKMVVETFIRAQC